MSEREPIIRTQVSHPFTAGLDPVSAAMLEAIRAYFIEAGVPAPAWYKFSLLVYHKEDEIRAGNLEITPAGDSRP